MFGWPHEKVVQINFQEGQPCNPATTFHFPKIQSPQPRDHSELLSRTDFQGLIVLKIDLLLDIRRTLYDNRFDDRIDEIIAMLERELEL